MADGLEAEVFDDWPASLDEEEREEGFCACRVAVGETSVGQTSSTLFILALLMRRPGLPGRESSPLPLPLTCAALPPESIVTERGV